MQLKVLGSLFVHRVFAVISKDMTNSNMLVFQIGKLSQGPCDLLRAMMGVMIIPLPLVLLLLYYPQRVSTHNSVIPLGPPAYPAQTL